MNEENFNEFLIGDPPPLIFTQILPLKKLAVLQLATTVCHYSFQRVLKWDIYKFDIYRGNHDFNSDALTEESFLSYTEHDEESLYVYVVKQVIPRLPLPPILRDMLKKYVYYVIVEVEEWANYHQCKIFCRRRNNMHVYNYVEEIVWKSDGEIDCRGTAIRMLSNTNISEMEKFRIMANYCLEEYFIQIGVPLSLEFENKLHEGDDAVAYWYKVIKGYSPSPGDEFDLKRLEWGNIHAFLYFWSRLNANQQMDEAVKVVKKGRENLKFQKGLLLKMNETQRRQILTRVGKEICCNFSRTSKYFRYGVLVWMHIREFITEEQYMNVMAALLEKCGRYSSSNFRDMDFNVDLPLTHHPCFIEFLTFIWRMAPDGVKPQCLDLETGTGIFTHFSPRFRFEVEILISLLVNILPTMEANHRRNVFDGIITNLAELEDFDTFDGLLMSTREPRLLDRFLTLCLGNPDEEAAFKANLISRYTIKNHCCYLIANGRFRDFDEFVAAYLPRVIHLVNFKIKLLTKMLSHGYLVDYYKPDPKNLKIFCSEIETEVLTDVLISFERNYDLEILFSLLVELLPDMNADLRRNILSRIILEQGSKAVFFKKLIVHFHRPLLLDKFIKLCLFGIENEVAAFKSIRIKPKWIVRHCFYLMQSDMWENMDEFLTLYSPREAMQGDNRIKLLNSMRKIEILLQNLLYNEKYDRMNKIVNVLFPQADSAEDFRKQFLLSSEAIAHFHSFVKSGRIFDVKNCIEFSLHSEEHIKMVKKTILQSVFSHQLPCTFFHCDDSQWSLFVSWFLDDDGNSNEFKNSLDLHEIFSQLLHEESELLIENNFHARPSFYALDRFLDWYFGSQEKVKEFKTCRIFNYHSISIISELATGEVLLHTCSAECYEKRALSPEQTNYCLSEILRWFFGNDEDLIQRFESAYSSHDIAKASFFKSIKQ